jgi:hypothetical protein
MVDPSSQGSDTMVVPSSKKERREKRSDRKCKVRSISYSLGSPNKQ